MTQNGKYYTIGVLNKSFKVIEIMTQKAKWELGELSRACSLPKGTLQRILLTLLELGYVRQEIRGGAYSLTLQFFNLGRRIASNNPFIEEARPFCRKLMESLSETVNLCVPMNTDMVVVDQHTSCQMLRLDSIIGSSFPIYRSASGKIWCAFIEEHLLDALLQEMLREHRTINYTEIETFKIELEKVRQEGLAFDFEEIFVGVRCTAAPIFDSSGKIIATISTSVPTVRITKKNSEKIIYEVCKTAVQISHSLGAPKRTFLCGNLEFGQIEF